MQVGLLISLRYWLVRPFWQGRLVAPSLTSDPLCAGWGLDVEQLLHGQRVGLLVTHHGYVVQPVKVGQRLKCTHINAIPPIKTCLIQKSLNMHHVHYKPGHTDASYFQPIFISPAHTLLSLGVLQQGSNYILQVGLVLDEFLCAAVQQAHMGITLLHRLPADVKHQTQHAVGSGVLWPKVNGVVRHLLHRSIFICREKEWLREESATLGGQWKLTRKIIVKKSNQCVSALGLHQGFAD